MSSETSRLLFHTSPVYIWIKMRDSTCMNIRLYLLLILSVGLIHCQDNDILGCGGFVKSDVEINFSLVEVKLYTSQGSLKYQVDCAPNNGYYMIPVYDKGDYILKVEPPKGWNFEPNSVELQIDGKTDACSRNEDINFHFIGFSVEGSIVSHGNSVGPGGVTLVLTDNKGRLPPQQLTTKEGGAFRFDRVLPSKYQITASHPTWKFDKNTIPVEVDKGNVKGVAGIVVHGYDVSGRVLSDGDPVSGVHFLIFSTKVTTADIKGCEATIPPGYKGPAKPVCSVQSRTDGRFVVQSLPSGIYEMVPFYKADKITFDVQPAKLKFTVEHDSLVLGTEFRVTGFSVSGRVLNNVKGTGVSGAKISVNDVAMTTTKSDGTYVLDNMKTGNYIISVSARDMGFQATDVKVTPNTPMLPDITPVTFSLCGTITIDKLPRSMTSTSKVRVVKITEKNTKSESRVNSDEEGKFCAQVKPGNYLVEPIVSAEETSAGLKLSHREKSVTVSSHPVDGVNFSQFKAAAAGKVTCIGNCPPVLHISLVAAGSLGDHRTIQLDVRGDKTQFAFNDLMPGRYQVQLVEEQRCWQEKSIKFELVSQDVTSLNFVQSGFVLTYTSSHDIQLEYNLPGKSRKLFDVRKGSGSQCVTERGVYTLVPKSCHQFDQKTYTFDTANPSPITINAVKHQIGLSISSSENVTDLRVQISSAGGDSTPQTYAVTATVSDKSEKGKPTYQYSLTHWVQAGETVTIVPSAKILLFYPPTRTAIVNADLCPGVHVEFEGRKGVFINGGVEPALGDVIIRVTDVTDPDNLLVEVSTDPSGKYSIGPLHDGLEYSVSAEREGYVMTQIPDKQYSFNAFKLGQINVKVSDTKDVSLPGVLLSVSGGQDYRSNKRTHNDGTMTFLGLSPGEYFLRSMMKEYQFEPATKIMKVAEGDTVNVNIVGKRVAYSCYGSVTSLNGEAESGVVVEAVGKDGCSEYQEESKTEKDGTYRISGLKPTCEYEVRLKEGDVNEHVDRAAPKSRLVKVINGDIHKMNIIAFRRMNQMDLSGHVVTEHEFLSTIKIFLYREISPDDALHSVALSVSNMFYLPSIPMDNQNYLVRLKSTLSKSMYDYDLPDASFTANSSYKHLQLRFTPKRRNADQDISHASFLIVPLTLLVLFLSYHSEQVKPVLSMLMTQVMSGRVSAPPSSPEKSPTRSAHPADPASIPGSGGDAVIRKKMKVRKT